MPMFVIRDTDTDSDWACPNVDLVEAMRTAGLWRYEGISCCVLEISGILEQGMLADLEADD